MNATPFLWQVAQKIVEKFGRDLFRTAVVFPNRRQSVYFKENLLEHLKAPALLPELLTIEELVTRSSDMALADPLRQSFALYRAYLQTMLPEAGTPMPFEEFYGLAQVLLNDLNETDAYCIPTEKIFSLIADYKEIDQQFDELSQEQRQFLKNFWESVNLQDTYQQRFADLWRMIPQWYTGMHALLQKEGYGTLGAMYRRMAEMPEKLPDPGWVHVIFVGFNALNGAEERVIKSWQTMGKASLYFDIDAFYFDNPIHEAGYFFRRNIGLLGLKNEMPVSHFIPAKDAVVTNPVQLRVTRVDGQVAQAKMVADWVQTLPENPGSGKAAILLADEKLLIPVLQSFPETTRAAVNITMGYPLAQSPLYSFLQMYFQVQEVLEGKKASSAALPWELAMQWLNHPLNDWDARERDSCRQSIIHRGLLWVPVAELLKTDTVGNHLFTPLPNRSGLFDSLLALLQRLAPTPAVQSDGLLQGLLSGLYNTLQTMAPLYSDFEDNMSLSFLKNLVMTPLAGVSIPFEAERTDGIQIMGLLESRGLDFEHILLLGAAEGSMPRVAAAKTFIPFNLRRAYGLSTLENQDAIFAWVFYRLLHRCSSLHAVYNGLVTDNSSGEVSRFIKQIAFESAIPIQWDTWQLPVKATHTQAITIQKTPEVLAVMKRYYTGEKPGSVSPSAINKYLSCRLQFYFQYIAGIKKPDEVQTEIDPAIFGTAVHLLLEWLYNRWMQENPGGEITAQAIDKMGEWLPQYLEKAIQKAWHEEESTSKNLLLTGFTSVVADVVEHFVKGFLRFDRERVPFTVRHTEQSFEYPVSVSTIDGIQTIRLKGNIDRVDEKDGVVRMVDYKTGGDKIDFASLAQLFETHGDKQNKAALQTLLYALMFSENHPEYRNFEPALVVLRSMNKKREEKVRLYEKSTKTEISAEVMGEYLSDVAEGVSNVLAEIFDEEVSFDQTDDLRICGYCDFKGICGR